MPKDTEEAVATEEESYESWTVAELRDELTARDLPTSGLKDELVARLEEDDAAAEAPETSKEIERAGEEEETPIGDPYLRTYHPYELPADPFAAQAFMDAHPDAVDETIEMSDEQQTQATAAIQERVDFHANMGNPVSDPRLGGDEVPDPVLTAITPTEALVGPPENVILTATGENFRATTQIAFGMVSFEEAEAGLGEAEDPKWERTTFVNGTTLTTVITAGLFPDADDDVPVLIGEPGGTRSENVISFAFIEQPPPAPPEEEA